MLHVHRAERSDRLVAALAEVLATPLPDPLATEVVAVHSRGIERWIAQELSTRLGTGALGTDGVCANLDFQFPGRLIRGAVAAASGIDPEHDPWLPERLTWPLLELVDDDPDAAMLGPLRASAFGGAEAGRVGGGDGEPGRRSRRFGAVRHVADLFDRYGVHRPEMVRRWLAGDDVGPGLDERGRGGAPLPARYRWQPGLWREVRERVGIPSFAERHEAALAAIADDPAAVDLPPRFALFGLTALPASYLTVLTAVAAHRDVHLLLLHPSADLWSRVAEATHSDPGQRLWLRENDRTVELPHNPLLRSWGRDARELQLVAPIPSGAASVHHHGGTPDREPVTLLQRIQADVYADRFPAATGEKPRLDAADRSVQLHDCHGRLRQVEVTRDAILHLLAEQPDLEPRDIIVMCPDIEAFAPLVTAVFGAADVTGSVDPPARPWDGGQPAPVNENRAVHGNGAIHMSVEDAPPALRVRLADRSLRGTNPVLEVVGLLLDLADSRVTASAVLDFISREPVRRRFRFDDEEVEQLESWIAELQIRWGLDAQHRRRQGLPALDANTWQAGLERLLLGMAMADEDLRMVKGVAPFDGVEGRANDLAGRLVELVSRLAHAVDSLAGPHSIEGWQEAIGAAADAVTLMAIDATWQRLQLHRILAGLVDEATLPEEAADPDGAADPPDGAAVAGASPVPLTLGEVKSLLAERLAGRPTTASHRTGDLTVCTLVPMRSVPHRVVCLLGLDDGTFPRQAVPDSDDLLQTAPRVGDRDPRSEDRQLLLDAVLAATETLVVTYAGRDERSNEHRYPAVPVDELLDVVDRTVDTADGRPAREHVTVRHPLKEHDPRNFEPGTLLGGQRPWGFDPATLTAAVAQRGEPAPPPPFLAAPLPAPTEEMIDLDGLVAFLQHPVKAFVQQCLEVTLPGAEEEASDSIPATLDALSAWSVGDDLLGAWLRGEDLDRALEVARARGLIPPGTLGDTELRTVNDVIERIVALCGHRDIEPGPRRAVDVEVELPHGRVLTGTVPDVCGWRVEDISYSRVSPKRRLATWARFLAVTAHEPTGGWEAATVGRHSSTYRSKKDKAQALLLSTLDGDAAERRARAVAGLQRLVDLYDRGRRVPLPLYCKSSERAARELRRDREPGPEHVKWEWATGDFASFDNEDRDPYHLLVLGGQIPTEQLFEEICADDEASWAHGRPRFVAYAWRLWEPIMAAERSCET